MKSRIQQTYRYRKRYQVDYSASKVKRITLQNLSSTLNVDILATALSSPILQQSFSPITNEKTECTTSQTVDDNIHTISEPHQSLKCEVLSIFKKED